MPHSAAIRFLGLHNAQPEDALAVIFTSGSTGDPKGVVLTNRNIAYNLAALQEVALFHDRDVILGVLPFFHSFGYTGTLWGPAVLPTAAAYHYSPLECERIGALAARHGVTALAGTPTFLRTYLRQIPAAQFATLEMAVAGGEKMPSGLAEEFRQNFDADLVEAYGITELGPIIAVDNLAVGILTEKP